MSAEAGQLRRQADEAARLYLEDRDRAEEMAREVLGNAGSAEPAAAIANRVVALVKLNRGQPEAARTFIDEAVVAGEAAGEGELLGAALLTRVGVRAVMGDPEGALEDAFQAETLLQGEMRVRAKIQRATVLGSVLGQVDEAIAAYDELLATEHDLAPESEAAARNNRGIQLLRRGDFLRAMVDHRRCRAIQSQLGNQEAADEMMLHLAMAAARLHDFPTVFALHAEVAERGMFGSGDARSPLDLSNALLIVGLHAEAEGLTAQAASLAAEAGNVAAELEAVIALAELAASGGQRGAARTHAIRAAELAARTSNEAWAARADVILVADERRGGESTVQQLARMENAIGVLEDNGWFSDAAQARLAAADLALELGETGQLRGLVAALPADVDGGDFATRTRSRHARAFTLVADGKPGRARRELAVALRDADRVRETSGAEDLRATGSDHVAAVARLGLELAVAEGKPRPILEWVERQRAASLRLALPRHRPDEIQRDALDQLRETDALDKRAVADLERTIAQRTRARRASTSSMVRRSSDASEIVEALQHRTLVEFLVVRGRIHAVVARRGRVSFHLLDAPRVEVAEQVQRLHFGLRRMASTGGARGEAAALVVDTAARALGDMLLDPLLRSTDGDLVIVPTHELHQLPWSALAAVASRAAVVAPSADLWRSAALAAAQRTSTPEVAVLAGPGLPSAVKEVAEVAAAWAPGHTLVGERAAVEPTLAAMAAADMAHLVAHGRIRHDNPQFSSLELHDGPLMIYDLERLDRMPSQVVLSGCSLATVHVQRGDDILGFPAALFGRGVRTLTAALLPVADVATRPLMVDYHRGLADGLAPSKALADAAVAARQRGHADRAAADSFMVLGCG